MSEMVYIQDDFGNRIAMLDDYGNLSVQVIMLYTEDKLSETDRKTVKEFAATDELTQDALDGYALTSNAPKTRHHLGQLNNDIQKRTGAAAVTILPRQESSFNYRKLAAAVAVLFVIGGSTFFGVKYLGKDQLAENAKVIPVEDEQSNTNVVIQEAEDTEISDASVLKDENDVSQPEPSTLPDVDKTTKPVPASALKEETEPKLSKATEEEKSVAKTKDKKPGSEKLAAVAALVKPETENVVVMEEPTQHNQIAQSGSIANNKREADTYDEQQQKLKADVVAANERADRVLKALNEKEQNLEKENEIPQLQMAAERKNVPKASNSAAYPGGDMEMYKFIERKKIYTEAMKALDLKGVVKVSFDIEPDGRVSNAKVKAGENGLMNEDALRVIRSMPQWEPAKDTSGEAIRSSKTVVIKYGE